MKHQNILICFCIVITLLAFFLKNFGAVDSIAYWSAVQSFIHEGDPYNGQKLLHYQRNVNPTQVDPQMFLNPPWALPALVIIFAWPFDISRIVLTAVSLYLVIWIFKTLQRRTPIDNLLITASFMLYLPFVSTYYSGQLSLLLSAGVFILLDLHKEPSNKASWKWALGWYLTLLKPQSVYLFIIASGVNFIKTSAPREILKVLAIFSPLFYFLLSNVSLFEGWKESFSYSSQWRTATLITYIRELGHSAGITDKIAHLIIPVLLSAIVAHQAWKRHFTHEQILLVLLLSVISAPYAWIYDFSVLGTHFYLLLAVIFSTRFPLKKRIILGCGALLLVVPLYALFSISFEVFVVHSVLLLALYLFGRKEIKSLLSA